MKKNILVIGTGTIGEPLISLICDLRKKMDIHNVLFHKNTPPTLFEKDDKEIDMRGDQPLVQGLIERGGKLCVRDKKTAEEFIKLGFQPFIVGTENAVEEADIVIDCTPKGFGHQNKQAYYKKFEQNTLGFIAQGSETGFGKPYVYGVSDKTLVPDKDRYIQVLSCNTHNLTVLIHTLSLTQPLNPLEKGDFVCMRRASDISQSDRTGKFIASPTTTYHDDDRFGTHHATDAHRLFSLMGYDFNIFSSAIKLNTQYMHSIRFNLKFQNNFDKEWIMEKLQANPQIALTYKDNMHQVFSFGRDHGHYGRILNNTVVLTPSLHIRKPSGSDAGKELIGFCFTPQDGNSLLSSMAAIMWFLNPENYKERMSMLDDYLYQEV
ncbi:hypothetical protein MYX06_02335 [Patescibacteria group bacterium AH-259-L05]|nr:hypothetical protein [Patescibacteria group bacterium AH-259-L05]